MNFVKGFLTAVVLFFLGAVVVMYTGVYNVAASAPDNQVVQWFLSMTMQHSVRSHARDASAPAALSDQQARDGFRIYNDTCIYCHGAPGRDPGDIGKGLNPEPPFLPDTAGHWSSAELFWIVKNGIKMTGMPGFGTVHKDDDIWKIVAFVQRLPKMSPDQYKQMEQTSAGAAMR